MGRKTARTQHGASTIVLILILAFFVILPLAVFAFETSRYLLIQDQLRSVTDAAALSGTAAMASAPQGTNAQRQLIAMQAAQVTFEQNSILQTAFNTGTNVTVNYNPTPPTPLSPPLHAAALNIILLDQNGKQVTTGNPASTMQIQAWYTDAPLFTSEIIPLGTKYTASTVSNGGLPMIDVILCFDVSGSLDDATPVILVDRCWDGTHNTMAYGQQASNTIFNIFTPPPTGTGFNVYPPQNLSYASYADGGVNSNTTSYLWSESPSPYNSYNGLRDNANATLYPPLSATMPEQGLPPGNYNASKPGVSLINGLDPRPPSAGGPWTGFTDVVINPGSLPLVTGGMTFPTVASLVEGARGNLESPQAMAQSCPGGNITGAKPGPGYFAAYWNYVLNNAQPVTAARAAAYTFFNTMNLSANSHFGLITFSDAVNAPPPLPNGIWTGSTLTTNNNMDKNFSRGGVNSWSNAGFPMPAISLDPNNTNFSNVVTALNGNSSSTPSLNALVPLGQTDIGDSLNEAVSELTPSNNLTRTGAKRAIILFTDGVPNKPVNTATGDSVALNAASAANKIGVPIYTIGLSQVPQIITPENNLLNATNGIAGISGNNATYIQVTNSANLETAFQTIARSLCVLQ